MGPFCSPAGKMSAPVAIEVADRFSLGPVFFLQLLLARPDAPTAAVESMEVKVGES